QPGRPAIFREHLLLASFLLWPSGCHTPEYWWSKSQTPGSGAWLFPPARTAKNGGMSQRGRPTLYGPEYPDLARRVCLLGRTNEELVAFSEVTRSTIGEGLQQPQSFQFRCHFRRHV